ncbi:P-type conjugative transfer ATPase TrbB [Photobacterium phosphoreum]|uniref:P-type conjugative transfer ATPase TrbB n=1 Tax=Photobacterium phosphoreum TaxID=659 RepID=UPI001E3562D1|nr:P-type conjugative transfer ATPase TrbB [Photobacterium phosphoreum]MCD9504013.1 P-type conjugative transfer ATPase TrbB [Photobacterium phosphoreum]
MSQDRVLSSLHYHLSCVGIDAHINNDAVTEIMLNPDGNLWVEEFGKPCYISHQVDNETAQNLINSIAASMNTIVNNQHPILECELLTDGSRFEGLVPPIVQNVSFTLRKKAIRVFTLEDYLDNGIMTLEHYNYICQAISEHRNILVIGGTASGKTTLVNAILAKMAELFPNERHVVIEDTNELQPTANNCVIFRTNSIANVGMKELLRATLRYRPDRIIVGEVRGGEALDLLKAWNTGHSGVATVHANSAPLGLDRIEQCIEEVVQRANQRMIASSIHTLIYIEKTPEGRRVKEISEVTGFDSITSQYLTQPI